MLFLVTALDCEARPLIQHYRLKRCQEFNSFPLYLGDNFKLAVSGMGTQNAMIACSTLAGLYIAEQILNRNTVIEPAWLNVGIGGHRDFSLGSAWLAHKVTESRLDQEVASSFYCQWPGKWPCKTAEILTVSEAVRQYDQAVIYDMEASAFCESALRFSTIELIQVLKVVSDNNTQSFDNINKAYVTNIIEDQLEQIKSIVSVLEKTVFTLGQLAKDPDAYEIVAGHFKVSVSNQILLKQLLRRWQLLRADSILHAVPVQEYQSVKQWMKFVRAKLAESPITF